MKVIIMGCGRVGEQVSRIMVDEGHEVVIIDQDPAALARLGPTFKGRTVKGVGFDRKVLIERAVDARVGSSNTSRPNVSWKRGAWLLPATFFTTLSTLSLAISNGEVSGSLA